MNTQADWLDESEENRRLFYQEGVILDATDAICEAMEEKGISRADLARLLGVSKPVVSRFLNGSNMTLKTFAHISYVLGMEATVGLARKREASISHNEKAFQFETIAANRPAGGGHVVKVSVQYSFPAEAGSEPVLASNEELYAA